MLIFLFLPLTVFAEVDYALRYEVMERTLRLLESKQNEIKKDKITYTIGLDFGYLKGNTTYDFDHHTSELEFPMDNFMAGGTLGIDFKNLTFNTEIWMPAEHYAGFKMKDKDWSDGVLISYTKSKAYLDAIIVDSNLRYDFYKKSYTDKEDLPFWYKRLMPTFLPDLQQIKTGLLIGYKVERFEYDLYDFYDVLSGTTTDQGQKVSTYKIKYYLPYLGLATNLLYDHLTLGMNINYSFYPTAKDRDGHLLRDLTFYGDYDKNGQVWLGRIYTVWQFMKNWKFKLTADGTFIRIDGRTWDSTHDPEWDKDQSTDSRQWLFWSTIEYRF